MKWEGWFDTLVTLATFSKISQARAATPQSNPILETHLAVLYIIRVLLSILTLPSKIHITHAWVHKFGEHLVETKCCDGSYFSSLAHEKKVNGGTVVRSFLDFNLLLAMAATGFAFASSTGFWSTAASLAGILALVDK